MHMRAQLLRIEQEKVLMQNRLEEETAEREKAQKQVGAWGRRGVRPRNHAGTRLEGAGSTHQ